jgi:glutaminase
LRKLYAKGVDLNKGDYDNRTPLHVACGAGSYETVAFLVNEAGVNVSPIDRWSATPLNDADPHPRIRDLLLSKGGFKGKIQPPYTPFQVTVSDDQFRLYYAAFFGNVEMMDNLRLLGWNVNGQDYDGRTALGVAAS